MKRILPLVLPPFALAFALLAASCGKKDEAAAPASASSKKLFTDKALTTADMTVRTRDAGYGFAASNPEWQALSYAEINEAQLAAALSRYRAWLFRMGIPVSEVTGSSGWNPRFNCAFFAESLVVFMGAELFSEKFQSASEVARPAVFVVHYQPAWSPGPHAIVQVVCAGRTFYVEPQDTRGIGEVKLTPAEIQSIYRRRA